MARFTRTTPCPKLSGGYPAFRPYVRADFERRCAYCLLEELYSGGQENYELDHFRPRSIFPELEGDFYNIYYSCHPCNHIKHNNWPSEALQQQGIYLVDLCASDFDQHFEEKPDGVWKGHTTSGSYTIDILRLNRDHLVEIRRLINELLNG
jgi:hypothetical protein